LIQKTIAQLLALTPRLQEMGVELQVFVVDDGSTDNTRQLALEAGAHQVVEHAVNMGLGAAVRSGLLAAREADCDIAVKFDADLQHDPADIPVLIQPIVSNRADLVYGNRFERISYRMPLMRRMGNLVFTRLTRWLTHWPIQDGQPGIFAANRRYLSQFYLPGDYNYTQQILVDAFHKGMRFAQIPVAFRPRTTGHSFISLKYPFKVLGQVFMLMAALRPLRVFGSLGFFFIFLGSAIAIGEILSWWQGLGDKPVQHVNAVMALLFFGLQTFFFGVLAHLIMELRKK
ncbi:MAG: glycosyltransferase family 2 protein, partial [Magnetococcales bacterium]|nr:glycosyltransferase family 2 protein [Magnetococcales bacterium]